MKKMIVRIVLMILIIVWMVLVFGFSNDNAEASSGLSYQVAKFFVHTEEKVKQLEPIIRKLAHLSEYMAGRIFVLWIVSNLYNAS